MTAQITGSLMRPFLLLAFAVSRINRDAVSATHCSDCGEGIPELRRVKVPGCQRCASCQQDEELRSKHGRG